MDFKGITWVGNVYEKFEAMCLEVEEAMYQDTVKYVGNQVQTVGASVKKFYSDVMQDLLLPTSVDPVKAADLSLNPYGDFGVHKKPKAIKEDIVKDDKQGDENSTVIDGAKADHFLSVGKYNDGNHPLQPSSVGLMKGTALEKFVEQKEEKSSCKHSKLVVRRKSKRNNHLPSDISRLSVPVLENMGNTPLCSEISEKCEAVCGQIPRRVCLVSDNVAGSNSGGGEFHSNFVGSSSCTAVASDTPIYDTDFQVESGEENEKKMKNASSNVRDGVSAKLDGSSRNSGVAFESEGINGNTQSSEPASNYCLPHAGDSNSHAIDSSSDMTELESENMQQCGKQNLEETCILVDREKVTCISQGEDKPRSYKKKIRKAFSTRRSSRKEEYKQLAVQQGKMGMGSTEGSMCGLNHNLTGEADSGRQPTNGFCESEWELL